MHPLFPQAAGLVVSSSFYGMLCVWRLSDWACLHTHELSAGGIGPVVDVGGGRIASGDDDGTLRLWDALSGQQLQESPAALGGAEEEQMIHCIALLPGGRMAVGQYHTEIGVWRLGEGDGKVGVLAGHKNDVRALLLLGGGMAQQPMLASASSDRTVRLWDVEAGTCAAVLDGHGYAVWALADLGGGRLLSGDVWGALRVWDVGAAACLATVAGGVDARCCNSLCVLADGRVASGENGGRLRIWAWDDAGKALTQEGEQLVGHTDHVRVVVSVGAGAAQQFLSGSDDSTLRLWGRHASGAWAETAVLPGHTEDVRSIAVVRVCPTASRQWQAGGARVTLNPKP